MWQKLGGRKFVGWGFVTLIWAFSVVMSFVKDTWTFILALTPQIVMLTGYYIDKNIKQKTIQNGDAK